jgi:hypothetical protein
LGRLEAYENPFSYAKSAHGATTGASGATESACGAKNNINQS